MRGQRSIKPFIVLGKVVSRRVEFDQIAPVYDETRRPPSETEVQTLVGLLSECQTVLDAGVGTGRYALPLQANHFQVVGADLSVEMMRRARAKGIRSLLRADVRRLPLRDRTMDAAFTAHVLQLIPDPRQVLVELGRVARHVVVVLLPEWSEHRPSSRWHELRERYRELAAELGYPLPERGQRYRHTLEELTAIAPPALVRQVQGPLPTGRDLSEWLARWDGRTVAGGQIPLEVHERIVHRLKAERPLDPASGTRPRSERFVLWKATDLQTLA